jgi:hypothetical protein
MLKSTIAALMLIASAASAQADQCDADAAKVASEIGAAITTRTEANLIFLSHPRFGKLGSMHVGCPHYEAERPDLGSEWDAAAPPKWFFEMVAQAAYVLTGAPVDELKRGAISCWQSALRSSDEYSDIKSKGINYQCQAFVRDGGGTSIDIFREGGKK